MSNKIDIHQQQLHQFIIENSKHPGDIETKSIQEELKIEAPRLERTKMKLRAIENSDLRSPCQNAYAPLPASIKTKDILKEAPKDKVSAVAAPTSVEEKLSESEDRAFFDDQMDLQFNRKPCDASDFMCNSRSMKLYKNEHEAFHGLNHIRKANRERLIHIAQSRALELSEMTKNQADKDFWLGISRGVLAIASGVIPNAQHILTGLSEAINIGGSMQKTLNEANKIPIQTKLDLIKGAEIPQLDEEQRNYARMVQELDACIQRLREMEMNTMHSIHQG